MTLLVTLFALELSGLSLALNKAAISDGAGAIALIRDWGAWVLRAVVAFAAIFIPFLFVKNRAVLADVSSRIGDFPVSRRVLGAHLAAIAIFGALSFCIFGSSSGGWHADALASLWLVAGISAIILGSWALIPSVVWKRIAFQTGHIWIYALLAFVYACVVGGSGRLLWEPTRRLTFALVHAVLTPILPGVFADPVTRFIGTSRFYVRLQPECSGLEGIGLILVFTVGWLALFRKECRFPNALALLPIGVVLMFLLNIARISTLILIGSAGASRAALEGFHSQAGWIVFNIVALVFAASARRIPWLRRDAAPASVANPVAPYLMPLLAILAVGMLSAAVNARFEWLYPLRLFAAVAMLWHFRKRYAGLAWRFTWAGPAIGALVFVLWIALDRLLGPAAQAAPVPLLAATPLARHTWLTFRILAAVVTVPIAEELAFRGFLLRRLISDDFESVSLRTFTWVSFVLSSALFGFLHGDRWLAHWPDFVTRVR